MLCDGSSPRSCDWFMEHLQNLTEQQEIFTTFFFFTLSIISFKVAVDIYHVSIQPSNFINVNE